MTLDFICNIYTRRISQYKRVRRSTIISETKEVRIFWDMPIKTKVDDNIYIYIYEVLDEIRGLECGMA